MNPTLDTLVNDITDGKYKQVVILSGAGISTNAGIPDYRSKSGIFAQLAASQEYPDAKTPETFFSRYFVTKHPDIFEHKLVKQFRQQMLDAQPTPSHKLAQWLNDRGILHRVFTQNVDGMYQKAGLPAEKIVEYHGNYDDGSIVLYGDPIPFTAEHRVIKDLIENRDTDLLIVMGSSLQVSPFCALPNMVNKNCTRVLVDIAPENAMHNTWSKTYNLRSGNDGMYSLGNSVSWIKTGGRRVSLRPRWNDKKKYPNQYIFKTDCDEWAKALMTDC